MSDSTMIFIILMAIIVGLTVTSMWAEWQKTKREILRMEERAAQDRILLELFSQALEPVWPE